MGWGPYVIDERVAGESITLLRNPNYWRADEGLPRFDRLVFRFIGENPDAGLAALLADLCAPATWTVRFDSAGTRVERPCRYHGWLTVWRWLGGLRCEAECRPGRIRPSGGTLLGVLA